jgi:hypothetical protein
VTTARRQQPSTSIINHNTTNKQEKETQLPLKLLDAHTGAVLHEFLPRQSLCKSVCYHNCSGSILQRYFYAINLFPNEVMLNINMLSASMVLGIVCMCNASLVICEDGDKRELLVTGSPLTAVMIHVDWTASTRDGHTGSDIKHCGA